MLLANAFGPDPRVLKEARSLCEAGADVRILAWDRKGNLPTEQDYGCVNVRRIFVPSGFSMGIAQIPFLFRLLLAFVKQGLSFRPQAIHCHDLDTLPAGVLLKVFMFFKVRLSYDSHENFPLQKALSLPRLVYHMLRLTEWICVRFVDHMFTASSVLEKEFLQKYGERVTWLPNYARTEDFSVPEAAWKKIREDLRYSDDDLVIAYIGGLTPDRAIIPFIHAMQNVPAAKAFICGAGEQEPSVRELSSKTTNVSFLGHIPQSSIIPYYFASDVIYYCLIDYPGALYNAPNNFSYSMLAGRPVIGSDVGDFGRFVKESGCGFLVGRVDQVEIERTIRTLLKERTRLADMRSKCSALSEKKYSWDVVGRRLVETYMRLLPPEKGAGKIPDTSEAST